MTMAAPVPRQTYQPYGIFDFTTGLTDRREPWLSINNAWEVLDNAYVFRGRMSKRYGYTEYGVLGTPVTGETLDTAPYAQDLDATTTNAPLQRAEKAPSAYSMRLYEDGGGAQESFDSPTNIDASVSDSGLWQASVVGEVATGGGGGTFVAHQISQGLALGLYLDSAPLDVQEALQGQTPPVPKGGDFIGVYFGANDPSRVLPNPTALEISWTLPAPASITIPLFENYDETVHQVDEIDYKRQLSHPDLNPALSNFVEINDVVGRYSFMEMNFLVAPGPVTITYRTYQGVVDYQTGRVQHTWKTLPTADVKIDYEYNAGEPVMGIRGFIDEQGQEFLVACTNRELWQYDPAEERFERQTTGAFPAGTNIDFCWFVGFETFLGITNGIDPVKKWDPVGKVMTNFGVTFNPDTGDAIQSAKIMLRDRNRIVYLNTTEDPSSTPYLQRGRWTPVNSVEYQGATAESQDDFVDAPTEASIITAVKVGDDIVVGMSRGTWWRFRYDGNPESPYRWERLLGEEGAAARMGAVVLPEQIIARGEKALVGVDGVSVRPVDQEIPDYTLPWNYSKRNYSFAHYSKELREILMTYVDGADELPNNVFSTHVDETRTVLSFSRYTLPFHCFGEYRQSQTLTWDDVDDPWDNIEESWDSVGGIEGFPIVLAGDRNSTIYRYGQGHADNGQPVQMLARTQRLNPFINPQGRQQRCHLGYITFQVDAQVGQTMTIRLYADFDTAAYLEQTIDISPDGVSSKVHRRVLVNRIASYHSVEIEVNDGLSFNLDGIWLYAKPSGLMQEVA